MIPTVDGMLFHLAVILCFRNVRIKIRISSKWQCILQNHGDIKSVPILQIMGGLKDEGYTLDRITFIDDTPDKIAEVKSSIPSMTTIPVESRIGECPNISYVPDDMIGKMIDILWKKIIQKSKCDKFSKF